MMVLITYDVETTSESGNKRLRKVAKACQNYGIRVQNSVFECVLDPAQFALLKGILQKIINKEYDSIRFYLLGDNWERRIEVLGKEKDFNQNSCIII